MEDDDKIQIFITTYGEILIKERDTLWIWSRFLNGPMLATDAYLFDQNMILIEEIERKEWKKHRFNMEKWNPTGE